jgi:hypothetical protein
LVFHEQVHDGPSPLELPGSHEQRST